MSGIDIDDIAGPDGESFSFDDVGDTVKGVIAHMDKRNRTNKFNGRQEEVLRISLEQDDGEIQVIWPVTNTDLDEGGYPSRMARAIVDAVRAKDRKKLEEGGRLAVKFSGTEPTDKGNPAKLYVAQYEPPKASTQLDAAAADSGGAQVDSTAVDDLF